MSDHNYTDDQLQLVADFAVLLKRAHELGLVVEIVQESVPPLAMGNLVPALKVRKSRAVYTAEASCRNH
jgi:hypothetical protein